MRVPSATADNGAMSESLDLKAWPAGSRVIVRRERAHPGAQLTFTDHDGHRFQAILTDQAGDIATIERDHRGRARVEDHIRNDKDTGLRNLPFRDFAHNRVWLEIIRLAHDLITWTQRLLLTDELARCEPKRLRYRLLHTAARITRGNAKCPCAWQSTGPRQRTPALAADPAPGLTTSTTSTPPPPPKQTETPDPAPALHAARRPAAPSKITRPRVEPLVKDRG